MFSQISRVCPFSDYVDYRPFHDWKYFFLQTLHKYVQFEIKIDFNKLKLKYFYNEYERYNFLFKHNTMSQNSSHPFPVLGSWVCRHAWHIVLLVPKKAQGDMH